MTRPTLIAVAHGSRNPAAQDNIRALLTAVRRARSGLAVREAFIELAEPSLPQVLGEVSGEVVVVPLLLGNGYHIAHDVAGVAAAYRSGRDGKGPPCAPALGPHPMLADALAQRLRAAECARGIHGDAVVLAAPGSSDPRSHADTDAMAVLLSARMGRPVVAGYNSCAQPSVADAVAALRLVGHQRVSVASYLMSPGRFADEIAACGADVVGEPIGAHPALVTLVLERYDQARTRERRPLSVSRAFAPAR
ncbi:MAG: sirohydrochlorin chelatase [Sporichthyaceae bacterium]